MNINQIEIYNDLTRLNYKEYIISTEQEYQEASNIEKLAHLFIDFLKKFGNKNNRKKNLRAISFDLLKNFNVKDLNSEEYYIYKDFYLYMKYFYEESNREKVLLEIEEILNENNSLYFINLIKIKELIKIKNYDSAVVTIKQLINEYPQNIRIKYLLIEIYILQKNYQFALSELDKLDNSVSKKLFKIYLLKYSNFKDVLLNIFLKGFLYSSLIILFLWKPYLSFIIAIIIYFIIFLFYKKYKFEFLRKTMKRFIISFFLLIFATDFYRQFIEQVFFGKVS